MKDMIMQTAVSLAEKAGFSARFRTIARSNAVDRITTVTLVMLISISLILLILNYTKPYDMFLLLLSDKTNYKAQTKQQCIHLLSSVYPNWITRYLI